MKVGSIQSYVGRIDSTMAPVCLKAVLRGIAVSTMLFHESSSLSASPNTKASGRRSFLTEFVVAGTALSLPASAKVPTGASDGNLPDLPSEAVRSYLQYRIPLQISADFYVFELRDKLSDISQWCVLLSKYKVHMICLNFTHGSLLGSFGYAGAKSANFSR